jgi:hypothetical protein
MYLYNLVEQYYSIFVTLLGREGKKTKEIDMQDLRLQAVPMEMQFF